MAKDDMDLGDFEKIPLSQATKPPDRPVIIDAYVGLWWEVVDECILIYKGRSPQCNADRRVIESHMFSNAEARLLPVVFWKGPR